MKNYLRFFFLLSIIAYVTSDATAKKLALDKIDPPLAIVNGSPLRTSAVQHELSNMLKEAGYTKSQSFKDFPKGFQQDFLRAIIGQTLLENEAEQAKLDHDPEILMQLELAKQELIKQTYLKRKIIHLIDDKRLKQRYKQYVHEQKRQWEVHAYHLLIPTEEEAKEVKFNLDKGIDFIHLAQDYDQKKHYDLGYIRTGTLEESVEHVLFKMKKNQVSQPIQTPLGWHIVKMINKRHVKPLPFDEIKPALYTELINDATQHYMNQLINKADIEYLD